MKINSNYISSTFPVKVVVNANEYEIEYTRFYNAIHSLVDGGSEAQKDKAIIATQRRLSFARFWDEYGKKHKKEEAWKLWLRLKDFEIKLIFDTLPDFIKSTKDIQFRPLPPTYLRGKRWEDELGAAPKKALPGFATENTFGR